jgi:hypothetical protein
MFDDKLRDSIIRTADYLLDKLGSEGVDFDTFFTDMQADAFRQTSEGSILLKMASTLSDDPNYAMKGYRSIEWLDHSREGFLWGSDLKINAHVLHAMILYYYPKVQGWLCDYPFDDTELFKGGGSKTLNYQNYLGFCTYWQNLLSPNDTLKHRSEKVLRWVIRQQRTTGAYIGLFPRSTVEGPNLHYSTLIMAHLSTLYTLNPSDPLWLDLEDKDGNRMNIGNVFTRFSEGAKIVDPTQEEDAYLLPIYLVTWKITGDKKWKDLAGTYATKLASFDKYMMSVRFLPAVFDMKDEPTPPSWTIGLATLKTLINRS